MTDIKKYMASVGPPPGPPSTKGFNDYPRRIVTVESLCDTRPVLVCSVYPEPIYSHSAFGMYELKGVPRDSVGNPDWDGFSAVWVRAGSKDYDRGEGKLDRFFAIKAADVALDILVRDNLKRGVFIAAGDVPTEDELEAAREARDQYLREAIEVGMAEYNSTGDPRCVPTEAKLAVQRFRVDPPWGLSGKAYAKANDIECPVCAEQIKSKAMKCRFCGAKLDGKGNALAPPEAQGATVKAQQAR